MNRHAELTKIKHLRHIVEYLAKHSLTLDDVSNFQKTYVPVSEQMKKRRQEKLATQKHLANLEKARQALKEKREAKKDGGK